MSSPSHNGSSSDSPSRQLLSEQRRRRDRTYRHRHDSFDELDSPSKQLLRELSRMKLEEDRQFYHRLDQAAAESERAHCEALALAAAEHDRVRRAAEAEREHHQLKLERERRQREENERLELERARAQREQQQRAEKQRQVEELARREEERQRAIAEERDLAEKEASIRRQKEEFEAAEARRRDEENTRRDEEASRRAREAADREAAAKLKAVDATQRPPAASSSLSTQPAFSSATAGAAPAAPPGASSQLFGDPSTTSQNSSALVAASSDREAIHQQYIGIHQRLKTMRVEAQKVLKQDPRLKTKLGDMRRHLRTCVGQLTVNKKQNRLPLQNILTVLRDAVTNHSQPTVDVRPYLRTPPTDLPTDAAYQIPLALLYLINIFAKTVIAQFIAAGVHPRSADPVGVAAVTVFGDAPLMLAGAHPVIDVLLAKFHRHAAPLFGVTTPHADTTSKGRAALGWGRVEPRGAFVSEQAQSERMRGLGAGFAALALRDFSGSKRLNPFPPHHYWAAVAGLLNLPAERLGMSHLVVLRALLELAVDRFVLFYGHAALAALRRATVELPQRLPTSQAAVALGSMPESIQREWGLTL